MLAICNMNGVTFKSSVLFRRTVKLVTNATNHLAANPDVVLFLEHCSSLTGVHKDRFSHFKLKRSCFFNRPIPLSPLQDFDQFE